MQPHVSFESRCAGEENGADVALDGGRLTRVNTTMGLQRRLHGEPLATLVTAIRFFAFFGRKEMYMRLEEIP